MKFLKKLRERAIKNSLPLVSIGFDVLHLPPHENYHGLGKIEINTTTSPELMLKVVELIGEICAEKQIEQSRKANAQ